MSAVQQLKVNRFARGESTPLTRLELSRHWYDLPTVVATSFLRFIFKWAVIVAQRKSARAPHGRVVDLNPAGS